MTEMISLTPVQILNLVEHLLRDPFRFFSNKSTISSGNFTRIHKPAPPESL